MALRNLTDTILYLLTTNKLDEAESLIEQELRIDPSNANLWFCKGKLAGKRGNLSLAVNCYSKTLELDSSHAEARVMIEMTNSIYSFRDPNLFNH